ncbi:diguanylate cyclase domain-containing protein [Saccharibacillus qingshengii]|uniref:diguanylate cyclase domain-containing protein n=1 Tax=Saccharibacillus qingshengii TaxID=1763540 RepID=UPI001555920B|nr:diguanylate cyclase [Saccharibacillus qingshengii]
MPLPDFFRSAAPFPGPGSDGEAVLRTALDLIPDLVVLKDRDGRWLFANRLVLQTHGLTESECLNRTDLELIPLRPEFEDLFRKNARSDQAAWEMRKPLTLEKKSTGIDGITQYWEVVKTPLFDADGQRQCLIVVSRNITERKTNEEAIKAKEFHYRLIADHMTDIVSMLNRRGETVYISPSIERVLGHAPETFQGVRGFPITHPEDLDKLNALVQETADGHLVDGRGDIRLRHRNGSYSWFEVVMSKVRREEEEYVLMTTRDIRAKKADELRLQSMAYRDSLTGIPNRRYLMTRLQQEMEKADRTGMPLALFYLDADKFKEINDTMGHAVGDDLLLQIARRIEGQMREQDIVARIGGDEFVVILPKAATPLWTASTAERLCSALGETWIVDGRELSTTSSIGIALYPQHGQTPAQLLDDADRALYAAKREGRACVRFYEPNRSCESSD